MDWIRNHVLDWVVRFGLISEVASDEREPVRRSVGVGWGDTDQFPGLTRLTLIGLPLLALVWLAGLPALDVHPLHRFGIMAPTCGLTRGVMWAARGDFARAARFNPASLLVLPAMGGVLFRAGWGIARKRWLTVSLPHKAILRWLAVLVLLALSVRQQSVAAFLLSHPAG